MKVWSRVSFCLADRGGSANKSASTVRAPLEAVKTNYQGREERSSLATASSFSLQDTSDRKSTGLSEEDGRKSAQDSMSRTSTLLSHLPHPCSLQRFLQLCLHPLHPAVMDCCQKYNRCESLRLSVHAVTMSSTGESHNSAPLPMLVCSSSWQATARGDAGVSGNVVLGLTTYRDRGISGY